MKLRLIVDKKKKTKLLHFFYKTNILFNIRINVKVYNSRKRKLNNLKLNRK